VKKKTDQINKIWKEFESPKKPLPQIIPRNDKITNPNERQKAKNTITIGEQ
jgi:hypothetical protein